MANSFSKEERVAFEDILEGFNDALVLSRNVSMYRTYGSMMERTNNIIWRPQPYIAQSFDGTDQRRCGQQSGSPAGRSRAHGGFLQGGQVSAATQGKRPLTYCTWRRM